MKKTLSLFASVALVAVSGGSAWGATLIGSELRLRTEAQLSPTSQLFVTSFPRSAVVSASTVEFPDVRSLFNPETGVPPGFARSLVNVAIDAGSDYLEIDFNNAGSSRYARGFKNTYVFTFTAPIALQIKNVLIDPRTTLDLTPERVTFNGNELFVNVQNLLFNSSSFARLNLSTITATDPNTAAVPEPGSILMMGSAALVGTIFRRYTRPRKSEERRLK